MVNFSSPQRLPNQRWHIAVPHPERAVAIAQTTHLSPLIAQVLINRGLDSPEQVQAYLEPESQVLPIPLEEFDDLAVSLELLQTAIAQQQKIAICGDYDADGMTSTALLLRALRLLGAQVDYAIPSRMKDGYGLNQRIVEEFHGEGVELILTVDNGIAAFQPIARARELGLAVIITDHHDLPAQLPPANAILNPKLLPESSPYRGLAGVGVAYVLAMSLAKQLGKAQGLANPLLELFTLGTIADLAPLTGVNRRWVKRGLELLPKSQLPGVQALVQVTGKSSSKGLKPEAIGFGLGPRINAVGRIADPQTVIELLTTEDHGLALERAMQCEQINQQRQQLCQQIEQEAIALYEQSPINLQEDRVLVLVHPNWHHGVIGIVASRLVERYGVPVFIATYEDEDQQHIRGSARSIPEFDIFAALEFSKDLLEKAGGHRAAGGFTLAAENLEAWRSRLITFARSCLLPQYLKPLISIDVQASLEQINLDLYQEIDALHPCGIENPDPVFWSANVQVLDQKLVGKGGHLKLTLSQADPSAEQGPVRIQAIAWRWGEYYPLPKNIDIAYRIRSNEWQGHVSVELELVGARLAVAMDSALPTEFYYDQRKYTCQRSPQGNSQVLSIHNAQGHELLIESGQPIGQMLKPQQAPQPIDLTQPYFQNLVQQALQALEGRELAKL
ncbi:MAG: single-stranded-DNA-specific exonuclease RecJ [Leptolyngbyaceae bacterium]|nr:single-stranded-DNA-specific exonuclease RecJ [Leptolyngbyaceae bacterium]